MPRSAVTDDYEIIHHSDVAVTEEQLSKIRLWLEPTDYLAESGEFRRHLASQAPGTGLWLTQTPEYQTWLKSPDVGSLWIKGVPGAGKSVIAAAITQHLKITEQAPVIFFFFRNIVAANFSPRALLQDWLAQLLPHSAKLQYLLEPLVQTRITDISDADLIDFLHQGLTSIPRVYCVADALDEMATDSDNYLKSFNRLATLRPQSVKILMTSRPKQYLQSALRDSSIVQIALEQQLVDIEIEAYLEYRLEQGSPSIVQSREVRHAIVQMITERSRGLFLYAKLTMDQIERRLQASTDLDLEEIARSLPVGLEDMYLTTLATQRHMQQVDIPLQVIVLRAVTHASRPLRLNELASFVEHIRPEAAASGTFKKLIAVSCGALIEILEDETLQIIHHSFTEFLRGETRSSKHLQSFPVITPDESHRYMTVRCLTYLQSGSLLFQKPGDLGDHSLPDDQSDDEKSEETNEPAQKSIISHPFDYQQAKLRHPFLSYAVENWTVHASHYNQQDSSIFQMIMSFANATRVDFWRWMSLQWTLDTHSSKNHLTTPSPLHLAAFCGLSSWAYNLCVHWKAEIDSLDCYTRTPLHWAAERGHADVVSLLLKHGAVSDRADCRGHNPLHLAARRNHAEVMTLLLQTGIDLTTIKTKENHDGRLLGGERVTKGECAISYVCEGGHFEAAMAMVHFCHGDTLEQLVCEAARNNRTEIVLEILRTTPVSPDATYRGATALYWASSHANVRCVSALLSKGARVDKLTTYLPRRRMNGAVPRTGPPTSPLHSLISGWPDRKHENAETVLKLLLASGADIEEVNSKGQTPLLHAARRREHSPESSRAIKALLAAGADPSKTDAEGNTALLRICQTSKDLETVRLLVEHGSEVDFRSPHGETPLCALLVVPSNRKQFDGPDPTAVYLLDHGADPNATSNGGVSPVEQALCANDETFKIMMGYCKSKESKLRCWFFVANATNAGRMASVVDTLLADGIDIESRNKAGKTLLLSHLGNEALVSILQERGALMTAVDRHGCNALHLLCQNSFYGGKRQVLERYIKAGVNPRAIDDAGNTLLHYVAQLYSSTLR